MEGRSNLSVATTTRICLVHAREPHPPPLSDFSTGVAVHSEEDAKQKIIMPYLRSLGYSEKEMRFENPITVQAGSRKVTLYSDIEILVDGRPEIIIDAKKAEPHDQ